MQVIRSINEMQSTSISNRSKGQLIGLVPTMGALHEGHASLIDTAKEKSDITIVSIFVNPTQFAPSEDFQQYPRELEHDLALCEKHGVDIVFAPSEEDIYPKSYSTFVEENVVSKGLCGISRPNHFRGVTTICAKLFNIVRPDVAVFGQKDAQQCAVIRKMIDDLQMPIELAISPTIREEDGLAKSSRNQYLTPEQRKDAGLIFKALSEGKSLADNGVQSVDRIIAEVTHTLGTSRRLRIIYASIVDKMMMQPVKEVKSGECLIAVACWLDQVRLIDNIEL
ncbi:pantoate--beta-alanine ligase [Puniceicoccus vermicola]|uniref:Pantothenate synthetase n=1 Tax=Puniceicoccus vermicola TaxID=388746 RepID=A0A7X1B2M0_9BACT|nr:pantoate--beta-alanine ligase [Puniceicoccus vermicola]MBC2604284.1 pantoate--beta-alanine ligase [Puniceicoccus vermicola]